MADGKVGRRLLVLGAGIGGYFAAAMLSKRFDETLLVDRDVEPQASEVRKGAPQGAHIHGILRRPLDIACALFPGFEDDLSAAGAIPLRAGSQLRFHDGGAWQPKLDLGFTIYSQTRPLLEHVIRSRVLSCPGVSVRHRIALVDYVIEDNRVTGAKLKLESGELETASADLVIDATGRGGQIQSLLKAHGYSDLQATELGVNICYASALFTRAQAPSTEPAACVIRGNPPYTRSGVLFPVEADRWVISLSGRFNDFPEANDEAFAAFAQSLDDPIIYNTIRTEKRVTPYSRFLIPRIYWRRYERMTRFPERLIPIGDALAGFNPVYGQGMAVAALHALEVGEVIAKRAAHGLGLGGVSAECLPRVAEVTRIAWEMSEPVDLAHEQTTGARPPGFEERIRYAKAIRKAFDGHPEVQRAFFRVANLLDPASTLSSVVERAGLPGMAAAGANDA